MDINTTHLTMYNGSPLKECFWRGFYYSVGASCGLCLMLGIGRAIDYVINLP